MSNRRQAFGALCGLVLLSHGARLSCAALVPGRALRDAQANGTARVLVQTVIVQADQAWTEGFDGTGQTVAIVDSGVDAAHPMLAGKVVDEACFSSNASCPNGRTQQSGTGSATPCSYTEDACGHGTHVAGIAAGSWPSEGLFGVARGARIIAVQVFSRFTSTADCSPQTTPCALAYTSDIIAGSSTCMRCARSSRSRPSI